MPQVAIVLGAGATLSDVSTASVKKKPPLDRGFFRDAGKVEPALTKLVSNYMRQTYKLDIMSGDEDSLERVMATVYTDLFNPAQEKEALVIFRAILSLFTKRLAETTNAIAPTRKRYLYRLIVSFLRAGCQPEDLTIVTFNQDLQAEKRNPKPQSNRGRQKDVRASCRCTACQPQVGGAARTSQPRLAARRRTSRRC